MNDPYKPGEVVIRSLTAGRLLCGTIRDGLERCRFHGYDVSWHESTGWIERTFTIKADTAAWATLEPWFDRLSKED